jgi:hypothetical protein
MFTLPTIANVVIRSISFDYAACNWRPDDQSVPLHNYVKYIRIECDIYKRQPARILECFREYLNSTSTRYAIIRNITSYDLMTCKSNMLVIFFVDLNFRI